MTTYGIEWDSDALVNITTKLPPGVKRSRNDDLPEESIKISKK